MERRRYGAGRRQGRESSSWLSLPAFVVSFSATIVALYDCTTLGGIGMCSRSGCAVTSFPADMLAIGS